MSTRIQLKYVSTQNVDELANDVDYWAICHSVWICRNFFGEERITDAK